MGSGQAASNGSEFVHEAWWATEGLFVIGDAVAAQRGDAAPLTGDSGGKDFTCPTFRMRAYCRCGGSIHLEGCPPEFEYANGFKIRWVDRVGNKQVANMPKPPGMSWELAVADCIQAVAKWKP